MGRVRPQVIIHAAAQSNVDQCEREPQIADTGNVQATQHVVEAARLCGARLVYVSTDYVFDGLKGAPYTETDTPHPINHYGQTKWLGEQAVERSGLPWLIVRPSALFGPGRRTYVDLVVQSGEEGRPVPAFADQTTSPSYTVDVAEGVARLLDAHAEGVVHLANDGAARRDVLARAVLERWGLPDAVIQEIRLAETPRTARRPPNSSLAITRVQQLTGWRPRSWEAALDHYLAWKKRTRPCASAL